VTDTGVTISIAPAVDVVVLDLWDDQTPDLTGITALTVEPGRYWLIDTAAQMSALAAQVADHGALTPIHGGLMRATFNGAGWRELLMHGGWFDAEDTAFGPGACAATLLHHVSVWIAPQTDESAHVYFAPSYTADLRKRWGC